MAPPAVPPNPPSYEETLDAIIQNEFLNWPTDAQNRGILSTDSWGKTPLHTAARMGYLHQVPTRMLTPKYLLCGPPHTDSALHIATRAGFLQQIPERVLTTELLLAQNHEGLTALFIASISGHLDHIPKALLTQKALLASVGRSNCQGSSTALHAAATIGEIKKIPPEILTAEVLLTPNSDGHTPIELVCLYPPSKNIRGTFSLETLLDLQKDSRTPTVCFPWINKEVHRIKTLIKVLQQQDHPAL